MPSYSVLLPCQKYDNHLRATLIGLSMQTIKPHVTVIVTDDVDCANNLQSDHYAHQINALILISAVSTITYKLNLGLNSIHTKYLMRCDAGDIPYTNRAQLLLENIEKNSSSMCFSRVHLVDYAGKLISIWPKYPDLIKSIKLLPIVNHIIHPSVMIRTESLISLGAFKSSPRAQDFDLWNEMIVSGMSISYVDASLSTYISRPNMKSVTAVKSVSTICSLTVRFKYFLITKKIVYLLSLLLRTTKFLYTGH
jgi:hypothetical protein